MFEPVRIIVPEPVSVGPLPGLGPGMYAPVIFSVAPLARLNCPPWLQKFWALMVAFPETLTSGGLPPLMLPRHSKLALVPVESLKEPLSIVPPFM